MTELTTQQIEWKIACALDMIDMFNNPEDRELHEHWNRVLGEWQAELAEASSRV